MNQTVTISRDDFRAAIDAALMANRDLIPSDAWVKLRKVGVTATEFRSGTFNKCPLGLAGYTSEDAYDHRWVALFAMDFDSAVHPRIKRPREEVGIWTHGRDIAIDPPPASKSERQLRWPW